MTQPWISIAKTGTFAAKFPSWSASVYEARAPEGLNSVVVAGDGNDKVAQFALLILRSPDRRRTALYV